MDKDTTAFRERFNAYKNGKSVSEIYDAGLPRYAGGKRGYIGGNTKHARETVWNTDQTLSNAVDSIANAYSLKDGLLLHRLNEEGFTDKTIRLYNNAGNQSLYTGENLLNNKTDFSGVGDFGLDDAGTMILNNQMLLKGEKWWDEEGENEQGRITHGAVGDTVRDTIGLQASALKYFSDQVKKDYPNLSDYDNARYTQAYYQRGVGGGRKWAKAGAKGYNFSTKPLAMRPAETPYLILTTIQNTSAPKFGDNNILPKYNTGQIPFTDELKLQNVEQWSNNWKERLLPSAKSKVLQRWNTSEERPQPESSQQYTDRRIKETTWKKPSGRKMLEAIPTVVDFVPGVGDVKLALDAASAGMNGNYTEAGLLGAGLLMPSTILNTVKPIGKKVIKNVFSAYDSSDISRNATMASIAALGGIPGVYDIITSDNGVESLLGFGELFAGLGLGFYGSKKLLNYLEPKILRKYYGINRANNMPEVSKNSITSLALFDEPWYTNKDRVRTTMETSRHDFDRLNSGDSYALISDDALSTDSAPLYFTLLARHSHLGKLNAVTDPNGNVTMSRLNSYGAYRNIDDINRTIDFLKETLPEIPYAKTTGKQIYIPLIYFTKYSNGKLPEYKDGKSSIHINPANRGKFTALKKRTGHSASWFKKNGTPEQKKMAVFALNARKWKH